jgi:hypothetical protein
MYKMAREQCSQKWKNRGQMDDWMHG